MYLLDPSEGLSREELLQKIWHHDFTQALRDKALKTAESRGLTWIEFLREVAADHDARMADPIGREEVLRVTQEMEEKQVLPFGRDPRIAKEHSDDDL